MKKTLIFTLLLSFLFLGCSTKRQYFEPSDENITGDMKFTGSLPLKISWIRGIAPYPSTLSNFISLKIYLILLESFLFLRR